MGSRVAAREDGSEARVSPLELFFDLVFVYALTQVTALLADDLTWAGVVRGMMVLAALWWAWVGYSWLTNIVDPDAGPVRLVILTAMAAMLVSALAVPAAFGDMALIFALAYFVVRLLQIALLFLSSAGDRDLRHSVLGLAPGVVIGPGLLIVAAFLDGWAQGAVWALALVVDFSSAVMADSSGWRLAPGHFAERHGLIVIIALGESIVAIGVGAAGLPVDAGLVLAAVLAVVVAFALWWSYFDVVAPVAERRLATLPKRQRNRMARDSYSYLHLPMVAGIVLFALGVKQTLGHVGDPLAVVAAIGLGGGVALYLSAQVAFRLRNLGSLNRQRVVAAVLCAGIAALATAAPALLSLALVALVMGGLIAYEALHFRDARLRVRTGDLAAVEALGAEVRWWRR
jgi:low temperature requirement protein LtrA